MQQGPRDAGQERGHQAGWQAGGGAVLRQVRSGTLGGEIRKAGPEVAPIAAREGVGR